MNLRLSANDRSASEDRAASIGAIVGKGSVARVDATSSQQTKRGVAGVLRPDDLSLTVDVPSDNRVPSVATLSDH